MIASQRFKIASVVAIVLVLGAVLCAGYLWTRVEALPPVPYNSSGLRGGFIKPDRFIVGANYPWLNYGGDFGTCAWGHGGLSEPKNAAKLDADFSWFEAHNIHVVRMWVFADGHAGLVFSKDGRHVTLDSYVIPDMKVLVAAAQRHHLMMIMVLFDYQFFQAGKTVNGVQLGGHADVAADADLRSSMINEALAPLFDRFANTGAIVAWEVVNEPEWDMPLWGGGGVKATVPTSSMQEFVREAVVAIHAHSHQAATIGSSRRTFLRLWKGMGMDFYQYHYYPWMETGSRFNYDEHWLQLDAPCIIGEVPSNDPAQYTRYLDQSLANHYAGLFGWSLNATDPFSHMHDRAPEIDDWQKHHGAAVAP